MTQPYTYNRRREAAVEEPTEENIGEVVVAEYIVFLWAVDTYLRYLEESAGGVADDIAGAGLRILRSLEGAVAEGVKTLLTSGVSTPGAKALLEAAFAKAVTNEDGVSARAYKIRAVITRGGAALIKHIFGTSRKAAKEVWDGLAAVRQDDPDMALSKLDIITLQNKRLDKWISVASESAKPRSAPPMSAVAEAAAVATEAATSLMESKLKETGSVPGSQASAQAQDAHTANVKAVEDDAKAAAQKVMKQTGEEDKPVTKSEAIAIATAVAAATKAAPAIPDNIPKAFTNNGRPLDPEQMAAALTDGKVLVAAGAGSGKCVRGDTLIGTLGGTIRIDGCQHNPLVRAVRSDSLSVEARAGQWLDMGTDFVTEVETRSGIRIRATKEHPLLAWNGAATWVKVGDMLGGEHLFILPGYALGTGAETVDPDEAYLIGLFMGDGCTSKYTVSWSRGGEYLPKHFHALARQFWGVDTIKVYPRAGSLSVEHRISSKDLVDRLVAQGVAYPSARVKEVPSWLLQASDAERIRFLQGLFDTDGTAAGSRCVEWVSASETLARQVHQMLIGLGVVGMLKPKHVEGYEHTYWRVLIGSEQMRNFRAVVGFRYELSKVAAVDDLCDRECNPNVDVYPHTADLLKRVRESWKKQGRWQGHSQSLLMDDRWVVVKDYLLGKRNPSRQKLLDLIQGSESDEAHLLEALSHYYLDEVVTVRRDVERCQVYDFHVPEAHSFVANGIVSHNTTCVISRIAYLIQDKNVRPKRIIAVTFAKKAAGEIKERVHAKTGLTDKTGPFMGTLNSMGMRFITGSPDDGVPTFGTPEEAAMMRRPRFISGKGGISPSVFTKTITGIFNECSPDALSKHTGFAKAVFAKGAPNAKKMGTFISKWRGNQITWQDARAQATSKSESQAAFWYECYMGLKGDIPGWRPPCPTKLHTKFMDRYRRGGERLGDMDDQLQIFHNILKRDISARKLVQGMFDHVIVDEGQDMNVTQMGVFDLMTEHVGDGSDGRSAWVVGDANQAIFQFRGSKPEQFEGFYDKETWKTRMIQTNYRCQPEIIAAANKLIADKQSPIPFKARPAPHKVNGEASITVDMPEDLTQAALVTMRGVRKDMDMGGQPMDHAVLSRTNRELNDFETACIINEIPYTKRGGKAFLDAPEIQAVLGYLRLETSTSFEERKKSLVAMMMKPNRGFYGKPEEIMKAVEDTMDTMARMKRTDVSLIDPAEILKNPNFRSMFASAYLGPKKADFLVQYRDNPYKGEAAWKYKVQDLVTSISAVPGDLAKINAFVQTEPTTEALMNFVLDNVSSTQSEWDKQTQQKVWTKTTLRQQISNDVAMFSGDDEEATDTSEEESSVELGPDGTPVQKAQAAAGLGSVAFLFELATPNANDTNEGLNPTKAKDFLTKVDRFAQKAEKLYINLEKWETEQKQLPPDQREKKPNCVTLSTCHSVKGLEWKNVTVSMPTGKFPLPLRVDPDDPPPTPEQVAEHNTAELNLAYVAMTRAAETLKIVCPMHVDGKPAGPSEFVFQAGLERGENVAKVSQGSAEDKLPPGYFEDTEWSDTDFSDTTLTASEADYYARMEREHPSQLAWDATPGELGVVEPTVTATKWDA